MSEPSAVSPIVLFVISSEELFSSYERENAMKIQEIEVISLPKWQFG